MRYAIFRTTQVLADHKVRISAATAAVTAVLALAATPAATLVAVLATLAVVSVPSEAGSSAFVRVPVE